MPLSTHQCHIGGLHNIEDMDMELLNAGRGRTCHHSHAVGGINETAGHEEAPYRTARPCQSQKKVLAASLTSMCMASEGHYARAVLCSRPGLECSRVPPMPSAMSQPTVSRTNQHDLCYMFGVPKVTCTGCLRFMSCCPVGWRCSLD